MYDFIIIGAGIQGAACAQLAAEHGYRVLILEQFDTPGTATSSKSSKLIHGGLRYLESGQFKLVHECLREREFLIAHTPLVERVPFYIPVYKNTRRSSLMIRLGLMIYALFSGFRFNTVKRKQWATLDGLKTTHLKTVFRYYDAQTDDQALTAFVMQDAQHKGAELITGAEFVSAQIHDDYCDVHFNHEQTQQQLQCKQLINASGPWVNRVLDHIEPRPEQLAMELVLGSHIVVQGKLEQGLYYLESPGDGRAVFVMPWQQHILIGTTEHTYQGPLHPVQVPDEDIDYLLSVYNHYFSHALGRDQLIDAFAGLRVLPRDEQDPFSRARDTIIHPNRAGARVYTLYGGKLTAHRATARHLFRIMKKTRHNQAQTCTSG